MVKASQDLTTGRMAFDARWPQSQESSVEATEHIADEWNSESIPFNFGPTSGPVHDNGEGSPVRIRTEKRNPNVAFRLDGRGLLSVRRGLSPPKSLVMAATGLLTALAVAGAIYAVVMIHGDGSEQKVSEQSVIVTEVPEASIIGNGTAAEARELLRNIANSPVSGELDVAELERALAEDDMGKLTSLIGGLCCFRGLGCGLW